MVASTSPERVPMGEAGEGPQAHGGVHALAVHHGGEAGAVAQVAADDPAVLGIAQHVDGPGGDVAVAGAVEAVAADVVLLIVLVGDGVDVGLGGHGHMEGGVEHGHLGRLGHDLLAGLDAHEIGGVVEGPGGCTS